MCLVADILGYSAYVIDFHLRHLSSGTKSAEFYRCRGRLPKQVVACPALQMDADDVRPGAGIGRAARQADRWGDGSPDYQNHPALAGGVGVKRRVREHSEGGTRRLVG